MKILIYPLVSVKLYLRFSVRESFHPVPVHSNWKKSIKIARGHGIFALWPSLSYGQRGKGADLPEQYFTATANKSIPPQDTILQDMPAPMPKFSATSPMIHGISMAPLLAAGSMIPMLVTLVIFPALATAMGFSPAMAKAKANSRTMAVH